MDYPSMRHETRIQRHLSWATAAFLLIAAMALAPFPAIAQDQPPTEPLASDGAPGVAEATGQDARDIPEQSATDSASTAETGQAADAADQENSAGGDAQTEAKSPRRPQLAAAREVMKQFGETRRLISEERSNWRRGRELLDGRIAMLNSDIAALDESTKKIRDEIKERQQTLNDKQRENKAFKDASDSLAATVVTLERRTSTLLRQLPEVLVSRIQPFVDRLPEDPDQTELSILQRFQTVLGILKEVNRFNSEISVSEMRIQHEGKDVLVTALFVGLGRGYYVSPKGDMAGIGTATAEGWVWTPADEAAPQIAKLVAIWQKKELPAFVKVPVDINSSVKEANP
jgi:hypothetical protein